MSSPSASFHDRRELWNIIGPYLGETGTYLSVTAENIPQFESYNSFLIR